MPSEPLNNVYVKYNSKVITIKNQINLLTKQIIKCEDYVTRIYNEILLLQQSSNNLNTTYENKMLNNHKHNILTLKREIIIAEVQHFLYVQLMFFNSLEDISKLLKMNGIDINKLVILKYNEIIKLHYKSITEIQLKLLKPISINRILQLKNVKEITKLYLNPNESKKILGDLYKEYDNLNKKIETEINKKIESNDEIKRILSKMKQKTVNKSQKSLKKSLNKSEKNMTKLLRSRIHGINSANFKKLLNA
jgi:hypothetical protein